MRRDRRLMSDRVACESAVMVVHLQRLSSLRCRRPFSEALRMQQCQGCEVPQVRGRSRDQPNMSLGFPLAQGHHMRGMSLRAYAERKSDSASIRPVKYRYHTCAVRGNPPDDFQTCGIPCLEPPPLSGVHPCLERSVFRCAHSWFQTPREGSFCVRLCIEV